MALSSKRSTLLQNANGLQENDWSALFGILEGIGFNVVKKFAVDYIESCDEQNISKIFSSTTSMDSLLPMDVIAYSFQFLSLNERMRLSVLNKFFENLMQSNAIWNDARIHVYPSNHNIENKKNDNFGRIQINYDSSESPCVMVPSSLFGADNFKFLNIIEFSFIYKFSKKYVLRKG